MKTGPKFKVCRRLGDRVFGKCQSTKFTVSGTEKKKIGKRPKGAPSEYALQLLEKQKAKFTYGVSEKQFSNYVESAKSTNKKDSPTLNLFKMLESRIDNVVYRLGLAQSRSFARQMVAHGHILVNGKKTRVPSRQIKQGDKISIRPQSRPKGLFKDVNEKNNNLILPEWLSFDHEKGEGEVRGEPIIGKTESTLDFSSILEFYSR